MTFKHSIFQRELDTQKGLCSPSVSSPFGAQIGKLLHGIVKGEIEKFTKI